MPWNPQDRLPDHYFGFGPECLQLVSEMGYEDMDPAAIPTFLSRVGADSPLALAATAHLARLLNDGQLELVLIGVAGEGSAEYLSEARIRVPGGLEIMVMEGQDPYVT